ncbi:DAPK2 kinase, partial [Alaudala cheleensis]|nr:DAPK2 kinase [Alaudala cheleensis]
SGHFGVVRLCRERSTGTFYAAKFLKVRRRWGSRLGLERAQVEREVAILRQLDHPNIMQLHDLFTSRAEVVLVLELIRGGELFDFIAEKEMLSEEEAIEFLGQILRGVEYLHARLIAHFDLKPENIMLQEKDVPKPWIKIIDFGLAQQLEDGITFKSLCGTPQYIAPEVINYEPLSPATDMCAEVAEPVLSWHSVALLCPHRLSGLSPFQGETDAETLSNVVAGVYEFEERCFSQTSEMAKDFIRQLLVKEPEHRMTAAECLVHPWIKPLSRKQALSRSRSSINMRNFRKFNARRKWKLSYNTVSACNRLCRPRLLCDLRKEEEELRCCVSDQEEETTPHIALLRRRRSSCS